MKNGGMDRERGKSGDERERVGNGIVDGEKTFQGLWLSHAEKREQSYTSSYFASKIGQKMIPLRCSFSVIMAEKITSFHYPMADHSSQTEPKSSFSSWVDLCRYVGKLEKAIYFGEGSHKA